MEWYGIKGKIPNRRLITRNCVRNRMLDYLTDLTFFPSFPRWSRNSVCPVISWHSICTWQTCYGRQAPFSVQYIINTKVNFPRSINLQDAFINVY